jgi:hypothetical protein
MRPRHVLPLLAIALVPACGGDDDDSPAATPAGSSEATSAGSSEATSAGSSAGTPVIDPGDGGDYAPDIDPANFVDVVDNPYFPMLVGSQWVYEGESDGELERVEIIVTDESKTVMGIAATVVRDSVYVEDELVEDTYDWFAQDADGNVWYLGEDSTEYENGEAVSTEGSWEAGVDGALPGIVMPAEPAVGDAFRQEFYAGEAEDMFEIIEVGGSAEVPAGSFDEVVTTTDWNPLEPDVIEEKQYAPGVGKIREEKVAGGAEVSELIEFTPPG